MLRHTSWTYGGNSLPQFRSGTIHLREEPTWLWLLGVLIDLEGWLSYPLYYIHLPKWIYIQRFGERTSLGDWYGTLGDVWFVHVFSPLFQWHDGHPKAKETRIELGYDKLKELLYSTHPEYFDEHEALWRE